MKKIVSRIDGKRVNGVISSLTSPSGELGKEEVGVAVDVAVAVTVAVTAAVACLLL